MRYIKKQKEREVRIKCIRRKRGPATGMIAARQACESIGGKAKAPSVFLVNNALGIFFPFRNSAGCFVRTSSPMHFYWYFCLLHRLASPHLCNSLLLFFFPNTARSRYVSSHSCWTSNNTTIFITVLLRNTGIEFDFVCVSVFVWSMPQRPPVVGACDLVRVRLGM